VESNNDQPNNKATARPRVILGAIAVSLLICEGGVRLLEAFNDQVHNLPVVSDMLRAGLLLDPYEIPSPQGGYHWVLKPNFAATIESLSEGKWNDGKEIGAKALQKIIEQSDANATPENLLTVNSDGFKGSEIDVSHSRVRILTIGDSCTFGNGNQDYPRYLQKYLNKDMPRVEVINAGVEGYSSRNVNLEMDKYLKLKPEIVTIYLGWNSLYSDNPYESVIFENIRTLHYLSKITYMIRKFSVSEQEYAMEMYSRNLKPDKNGADVRKLDDYSPAFLWRLEKIIAQFQDAGTRVILLTLPGLFSMNETPSPFALKAGHLPEYTHNPYVLAKLTERYNEALKRLAQDKGVDVVDMALWSETALQPKEKYFSDSVHMTSGGMELIGEYLAKELSGMVENLVR